MSDNSKINPAIVILGVLLVIEFQAFNQFLPLVLAAPESDTAPLAIELLISLIALVLSVVGLIQTMGKSASEGRGGQGAAKICLILFLAQVAIYFIYVIVVAM